MNDKKLKLIYSMGTFSIFSKKVLVQYLSLGDYRFNHITRLKWLGYKSSTIEIQHGERKTGNSTYTFKKLLNLAEDTIIFNSNKYTNAIHTI